jgi:hypothetical protein
VVITISASTLTGDDDQPAHLQGHGPIIASMARQVAATGTWRCAIVDDEHGTLMGLGTSTYTPAYKPTERLRRHLFTRDRTCRVPGCNTPAELCDIDHCTPWPSGATCECSTECLCPNHHKIKHETGFALTPSTDPAHPPGTLIWTTPAGHQYPSYPTAIQDPTPHPPDHPRTPETPCPTAAPINPSPDQTTEPSDPDAGISACYACAQTDATIAAENQLDTPPDTTAPRTTRRHPHADDPNHDAFEYEKPDNDTSDDASRLRPSYLHTLIPTLPTPKDGDPPPF